MKVGEVVKISNLNRSAQFKQKFSDTVKLKAQGVIIMSDIDLSGITQTITQSGAMNEFYVPIGMADFNSSAFDRPGYWAVVLSEGEAEGAIYLGENIESIPADLLSFSEYGVNYDPFGENSGDKEFKSITKGDRLILCSHPDSDPSEDCDIFIKIK
jgi:hypothetical protein